MGQVYDFTITENQRNLIFYLLNQCPAEGGRTEGRKFDRAGSALEQKVMQHHHPQDEDPAKHVCTRCEAIVRLTYENVEILLRVIDWSMKAQRTPDGREIPPPLTVAGFRSLRPAIDKLEAAQKAEPIEGVEVLSLEQLKGNGKDPAPAGEEAE